MYQPQLNEKKPYYSDQDLTTVNVADDKLLAHALSLSVSRRARHLGQIIGCGPKAFPLNLIQLIKLAVTKKQPFLLSVASCDFPKVTVLILYACSGWWEM